ncbi:MAG: endolytic transglycosylase MltG [Lachnospiraceae bacterium]|nr:endolytic transglycosylase MltG [Lachnospiraceae bacterium]
MKMKYFLRGLGTGILSATILLFCVYSYKMSDSKIAEKARALGMEYTKEKEYETEYVKNTEDTKDISDSTEETSSTKEEETTTLSQQESTSKSPQPTSSPEVIDVSISSGMNSESVSDALEAAGVINNAKDFNQYLIENNMGRYIKSGEYSLRSGMSYEEIADILQKGR